jgi:thioredoxin 1
MPCTDLDPFRARERPQIDGISFFRVDYDKQKDVVAKLACPRSTVIAYRGGKEVARTSWGIMSEDVTKVLRAALRPVRQR